jgi:hypothetical protein
MLLMLLHPSMAQRQMVKRVDGKGVMSAVNKAMYVSSDAAGRLAEGTLSSSQWGACIRAATPLPLARGRRCECVEVGGEG